MKEERTIPFVDLVRQFETLRPEIEAAVTTVMKEASFIGGPHLQRFEAAFAAHTGTKHAVGVGNGTDALYLTLRALGVGRGDEVLVPANTFIATAEAVGLTGATPVFVEAREDDALIDLDKAGARVSSRTKAMLPVHLYGQLVDVEGSKAFAEKHGLLFVEDAAQAHAASKGGKRAGSFGRAAGFSFYPGKNLGAYGDAGAVTTDDADLAARVRKLANHGRSEKYGHELEGVNSRLDGLQAAILDVKLKHLDAWTARRQTLAERYDQLLGDVRKVKKPVTHERAGHVHHLYVIRVDQGRDGLRAYLKDRRIETGVHYPIPLHLQRAYAHLGYAKGAFPVAERWSEEIVSLPMSADLSEAEQDRVVAAIRDWSKM
ncbi:MAG: DegT/DnrJ/EryC1/StrS family aminotransferase [Deltaproteobacteria bacterium]|nr:DegT/DnrJ/EryC1/StrS family aminotransferase [Deltaproteobacteria bacterium]